MSPPAGRHDSLTRTARTAGLLYLALGITGGLGFLLVRPALYVPGDASATLAHLLEHGRLARTGVALEMATVMFQALAALWFYRLFRSVNDFVAGTIAVFGLFNAIAVFSSAALLGTALQATQTPIVPGGGDVQLAYLASANFWQVGNLFFGLWLMPMGWCTIHAEWKMPRVLGWILIVGGVGYILNAFLGYLAPGNELLSGLLVLPATIGEFWMIGYLIIRGVGRPASSLVASDVPREL